MEIRIKLLSSDGKTPTQGNLFDAGYDLYAAESAQLSPQTRVLVKTDISIAIPEGFYGRIAPRSGLAYKSGIDILAGVIDSLYRGNIGIILYNTDKYNGFEVKKGDRIAQLIIEKCHSIHWLITDSLDDTTRGNGGYGSTG